MDPLVVIPLITACAALTGGSVWLGLRRTNRKNVFDPVAVDPRWEDKIVYLSVAALERIANPVRLRLIMRDREERLDIVEDTIDNGIAGTPLTVVVDHQGKIALKDGHHRLLVAKRKKRTSLPVRIKESRKISSHGLPAHEVLLDLLQDAGMVKLRSRSESRPSRSSPTPRTGPSRTATRMKAEADRVVPVRVPQLDEPHLPPLRIRPRSWED